MRTRSLNTSGFGLIGVLIIIVALAVVAGGGAYVYHKNHKTKTVVSTNTSSTSTSGKKSTSADPYAGWTKVANTTYGLSFYYPSSWYVLSYDSAGNAESGADPLASQYSLYAQRPTNGIENDACVNISGGAATNASDFRSGSIVASLGNNLQIWQNGSTANSGFATAYLVTNGQQVVRLSSGKTIAASAALSCGQGMNVSLNYTQQLANDGYQTAVSILKSVTLN